MWSGFLLALCLGLSAGLVWLWRSLRRVRLERDQLRRALSAAEERYRETDFHARAQLQTLFNSMVDGVILVDENGRIQLVNQALERQFNVLLDVRGLTVLEAIGRPEVGDLIERLRRTRQVVTIEIELNAAAARFLEINAAAVLGREGQPQGAILVIHDLTRIRQLENTRREFVANVSHELRTPLSLIKGYVETLLTGAKDDPDHSVRFLQKIEHHSNRLHNLIEDLLTISRLESGQVTLKLDTVNLREFSGRLLEEWQGRAAQKGVSISNDIPQALQAQADRDRLQQVFVNLLDNAIKYGNPGGHVRLSGQPLTDQFVQVGVSDDGPGIPPEARERIFERFYRVDKARSRETGGTGLGLSIVKHIVQSHGGEVWVESQLGHGAHFFFTLPRPPD